MSSWLTPVEERRLGRAVATLLPLGRTYLVGSSLLGRNTSRPPRDVDLRMIVDDSTYDALPAAAWTALADHIGASIEAETRVPRIDFQIQSRSAANEQHPGIRSAIFLAATHRSSP